MLTEKRVNVPDIRDVLKFWEMKYRIRDMMESLENIADSLGYKETARAAARLTNKIESIGKKE